MRRTLAVLVLVGLVTGCSQSAQQTSESSSGSTPAPGPSNPIDFPLYQQSTVIAAHDFKETMNSRTVTGTEVIAQNPATYAQLSDWIKGIGSNPPSGYTAAPASSGIDIGRARAQRLGVDFEVFTHEVNGKPRGLIVIAVDPTTFNDKAGPALSAIGKYKMLPQSLKDAIDAQVKARTGFTLGDALNPNTPIGGAIQAVNTLHDSGQRGIVLIDGTKE